MFASRPAPNVAAKAVRRLCSSGTVRQSLLHQSVAELFGRHLESMPREIYPWRAFGTEVVREAGASSVQ
jgi:hypothetical protein